MTRPTRMTELGKERQCARCEEFWPLTSEFFPRRGDGFHSYCKACCWDRTAELKAGAPRKHIRRSPAEIEMEIKLINKTETRIRTKMAQAYDKAMTSMAGYKFLMFGYWAAEWVKLNGLLFNKDPNPFKDLVICSREMKEKGMTHKVLDR